MPPLDPQLAALVDAIANNPNAVPTHELTPEKSREGYLALSAMFGPGEEVARVEARAVPGPAGDIPVRIYTPITTPRATPRATPKSSPKITPHTAPEAKPESEGPFGILVFYHGGGWVLGDLDSHDRECRALCNGAGCIVVSVQYRLAPEHPFPAAPEDAYAALKWVSDHASEIGGDPERLAVGGDSAGGNLSAAVTLMARDRGGPALRFQLLIYPAVDCRGGDNYSSYTENAKGPFLLKSTMNYFERHYFGEGDTSAARHDLRASPLLAASHEGLPAALIVTAEFDVLRDEGKAYAKALEEGKVSVQFHCYPGMSHLFFQLYPIVTQGKALLGEACTALRHAIG